MNSSFITGSGEPFDKIVPRKSTEKKQAKLGTFVYKLPRNSIGNTSANSQPDQNESQNSNSPGGEKSPSIINSTVDSSKISNSEDGWTNMDDFEEPASQRKRTPSFVKKSISSKVDFKPKLLTGKHSTPKSLTLSQKISSKKQQSIIDLCNDNSSDSICAEVSNKPDKVTEVKDESITQSRLSPILSVSSMSASKVNENVVDCDLNSWLEELNSNPALDPVSLQMPEYELSSTVAKLKKCDQNILEQIFKWFVNLPPELAEKLPGCVNAKSLLTRFKITRQRVQAKIKRTEVLLKKKRNEKADGHDSLFDDSEEFTSAADLIRNNNEINNHSTFSANKLNTVNNSYNSVASGSLNCSFNGVSDFINDDDDDNSVNRNESEQTEGNPSNSSNISKFLLKNKKSKFNSYMNNAQLSQEKQSDKVFTNNEINISGLSNKHKSSLSVISINSSNSENDRNYSETDQFSGNLFPKSDSENYPQANINTTPESFQNQNSMQSAISLNTTADSVNNSSLGGFVQKVGRNSLNNRKSSFISPLCKSSNVGTGISNFNQHKSEQTKNGSPFITASSSSVNFQNSTPNSNVFNAPFFPKEPHTSTMALPRGGESFCKITTRQHGVQESSKANTGWPVGLETQDFAQALVEDDIDNFGQMSSAETRDNIKLPDSVSGKQDDARYFKGLAYPHSREMFKVFRETFGLHSFRPNQMEAMNAALLGKDCFILMPTGGGKSVCYQLPALLTPGVTIVISPLISLIYDQVQKLRSLDIPADFLLGSMSLAEVDRIFANLYRSVPDLKILFVTPEKVIGSNKLQDTFGSLHKRDLLARFVIDEAHCVSQWGHDFRPDYKQLSCLRQKYNGVPIMALTATATVRVRYDILHQLQMQDPKWFISSFDRPNLRYQIFPKSSNATTLKEIVEVIKKKFPRQSGIVYCFSRHETGVVADALKKEGIKAACYHAGLSDTERTRVQSNWISDRIKVVCATIAFGMGIDKPDVRFVIHFTLPKSLEGYYQEAGRAGRDGEPSSCILYYSFKDLYRIRSMIEKEGTKQTQEIHLNNLWTMVRFCEETKHCRRVLQLKYFDENYDRRLCIENAATTCDNCLSKDCYRMIDVTAECKQLFIGMRALSQRSRSNVTINQLVDIVKGCKSKKNTDCGFDKLSIYNMMASWNKVDINRLFHKLVLEGYFTDYLLAAREDIVNAYVRLGPKANCVFNDENFKVELPIEIKEGQKSNTDGVEGAAVGLESSVSSAVREIQEKCYTALMDAIRTTAEALNMKTASIFPVQAVRSMSRELPESEEEMLKIVGVTHANFEKYGKPLLEITQMYAAEKLVTCAEEEETEENNVFSGGADWAAADSAATGRSRYFTKEGKGGKRKFQGKRKSYKRKKTGTTGKPAAKRRKDFSNSPGGSSGSYTANKRYLSPNVKMPPSNRPGFMPDPRVYHVKK